MYSNILVAVDVDHPETGAGALELARAMAAEGASITALYVLEALPSYATQYLPEEHLSNRVTEFTNVLAAELGNPEGVTPKVVTGHSGATIVDYATDHGVDCIVISSHKPGLQDFFLGSTAARVVRHSPCSVHVIR
ncbi:universal stress protein [Tropicimonas sp. S265A]|uniref:universal stress protein n=1 Tax=Tropicimonas sp. S265A TaxID=3415134 RepID=UPI003C7CD167